MPVNAGLFPELFSILISGGFRLNALRATGRCPPMMLVRLRNRDGRDRGPAALCRPPKSPW